MEGSARRESGNLEIEPVEVGPLEIEIQEDARTFQGETPLELGDVVPLRPGRALAVGEPGEVDAVDQNRATGGVGETAEDVEEGGLARTGWADDGDEFAWLDSEVNFAEGGDFEFAGAVGFAEVLSENDWLH